ncbi:recombinase family protein [Sphingobacterium hotanense]|uniref:Recombinase family protein n=1 Tax=Sphingobacterium hotanense TaxID=649196 RepID=A0ABT7NM99_9SPHI|nr:recombinase family protein [Sphingobacterium hotanense]
MPLNPSTLGEHIRKRRMELQLFQKDVAAIFNVSEDCITYWENNISEPQIQYYPPIFGFLGDGVSGKTVMEHPETKRMLKDVRSGEINGLVFSKLSRLARSTKEL